MLIKKINYLKVLLIIVGLIVGWLVYHGLIADSLKRYVNYLTLPAQTNPISSESIISKQFVPTTTTPPQVLPDTQPQVSNPIKSELLLNLPFSSQAPLAVWNERDEEACEEASLIMVAQQFDKISLKVNSDEINSTQMDQEINRVIDWERQNIGEWKSTTAEQTAKVARELYHLDTKIISNPNLETIKSELNSGRYIIVPAAGRELNNPYFKQPGPLYHMLVIRGYDKNNNFIVNDPGTKRGQNYRYNYKTILNTNHDWLGGDVQNGQKVVISIGK